MKTSLIKAALAKTCASALLVLASASSGAVDFAYFQDQSCDELNNELVQLRQAEKAANEAMQKEKDKASRDKALGIASAFLLGFGWWKEADHSNTLMIQAEIRDDLRMVTRAASQKKCKPPKDS